MTCFVSRPSVIALVKFHSLQVTMNREKTIISGGISLSGFFCVHVFGFPIVWKTFISRGWNTIIPPGIFFSSPYFGSAVERWTLNAEDPGSSPAFRAFFFAFFYCMSYKMSLFFILIVWHCFVLIVRLSPYEVCAH